MTACGIPVNHILGVSGWMLATRYDWVVKGLGWTDVCISEVMFEINKRNNISQKASPNLLNPIKYIIQTYTSVATGWTRLCGISKWYLVIYHFMLQVTEQTVEPLIWRYSENTCSITWSPCSQITICNDCFVPNGNVLNTSVVCRDGKQFKWNGISWTWFFDVSFVVSLNKLLNNQSDFSWFWWT